MTMNLIKNEATETLKPESHRAVIVGDYGEQQSIQNISKLVTTQPPFGVFSFLL